MSKNSYVYYEKQNNECRLMNLETDKFKTVPLKEVYKLKAFHMLKGYEPTDKELKQFGKDFMIWVDNE